MLRRSCRSNPIQIKAELTSCGYRGERHFLLIDRNRRDFWIHF